MKYLSIILITILAFFVSSCETKEAEKIDTCYDTAVLYSKGKIKQDIGIYKYEYEGHMYQYHRLRTSHGGQGGPVHDPDCPCLNNNFKTDSINNEITNNF